MAENSPSRLPAEGRVVMLSGANRGIGAAIARRLHEDGYSLSLGLRQPAALSGFDDDRCLCHHFDAMDAESPAAWVAATMDRFGRLDGLVNNAGIGEPFGFEDGDEAAFDRMLEVNVKAPYRLIQAALPGLRAAGSGRIVNITSLAGIRYKRGSPGYVISKFAAMGLTSAARALLWQDGIRVTAVAPGPVNTDMMRGSDALPSEDMTQPGSIADVVAMVLALPNTASVSLVPINALWEPMV
ncbi:MAG: SDR family NAD(P)-dependent oxidoreductase [Alphaproteobacteria bacterium]|jgi:NAD(P)-dependent dehydrogenase (short-subunit alcohol dehydrogenase family)|nr:SDR family NAD(P)-dependent oxidoreductase [Alphaproteobacteria bacterium]MDP6566170.1 SDR family NAD(P)-dependent oxidoreductase [Alphaproteobacteria bacterium]MDP6813589.1 SDR family NAD(P)-dependent oxidoreductase [Alphaproteobacteria bacterium]